MKTPTVRVEHGDCRDILPMLEPNSVQCCVTSPPYWGLRDYGIIGQIGLEPTPSAYIADMVRVFRAVRRVLRLDGTCWLNLGDTYSGGGNYRGINSESTLTTKQSSNRGARGLSQQLGAAGKDTGLCAKNLIGIPWRVALALQEDGWFLRCDIIWHKPNPMPESVRDRPTKSHEYVFLLSKSPCYFYDADAIAEPSLFPGDNRAERTDTRKEVDPMCLDGGSRSRTGSPTGDYRNKRSVWTVATQPYAGSHFATFPAELIKPCILAGCPVGGTVLDPFAGSGTTGMVALELARSALLIELNEDYMSLINQRLQVTPGLPFL